jgi:hypothetical protein
MARPKGALNKRTRDQLDPRKTRRMSESRLRWLENFSRDPKKPDAERLRATDLLLTFTLPKPINKDELPEQPKNPAEALSDLARLLSPSLAAQLFKAHPEAYLPLSEGAFQAQPDLLYRLVERYEGQVRAILEKVKPLRAA